jgi:hypothetical protein
VDPKSCEKADRLDEGCNVWESPPFG